ncbi:MAG: putative transrane protein [Variovorax sp.]|nr:putative transrane protein [Variovorax sp.]
MMQAVRAVLWSFVGLGGRRADAETRTESVGILPLIAVALLIVLLLVVGLISLARVAAGT